MKKVKMESARHNLETNRQPVNAGGFRRLSFTKPENDGGNENKQQVKPALRLQAGRYAACLKKRLLW